MTALFGGLQSNWLNMQKTRKDQKVTGFQDDDLWELKKKHPNKLALWD
jgi:hypothetical protein